MEIPKEVKSMLSSPRRIVITTHERPDGDAIGSALALGRMLEIHQSHQVTILSPSPYPQFLAWMPGIEKIVIATEVAPEVSERYIEQADLLFCLDFGEYHRLGALSTLVKKANTPKIVIDHHPKGEDISPITLCDPSAAATAILLYELFVALGLDKHIDKTIATALYVAIVTDTGFFGNSNTTARAHFIASKLADKGVNIGYTTHRLQGNNSLKKLRFTAHVIRYRLFVNQEHHFAYFAIPQKDFRKFNLGAGETGGLVKYALNLEGVSIAVLLTQQKESVSLSFRSFGDNPVNKLAELHFQGGGHKNAAGGRSEFSLKETREKLELLLSSRSI